MTTSARPSTVVIGGGVAGLAAALALARRGAAAELLEAGTYPRDKVCGEFYSPEVDDDMRELAAADWRDALAPVTLSTVLISSPSGRVLRLTLPAPGWGVTRRRFEAFLAERARACGVQVRERAAVRELTTDSGGWRWRTHDADGAAGAAVVAVGKRSQLDATLGLPRARQPEEWSAAKAYVPAGANVLDADIELHLVAGGYVGMNSVGEGQLGICGLLRGEPTNDWAKLRERFAVNPLLERRLDSLPVPAAVHGLARFGFRPQRLVYNDPERGALALLCGDAARLIPSFTGDGIAVALRSGRAAATALAERDPASAYANAWRRELSIRFQAAALIHRAFLAPPLFEIAARFLGRNPALLQKLYDWTRGRRGH